MDDPSYIVNSYCTERNLRGDLWLYGIPGTGAIKLVLDV